MSHAPRFRVPATIPPLSREAALDVLARTDDTDANVIQMTREGVATGLVGIPNRYMHSPVEIVHLDDLERAAQVLAEFCLQLTPAVDWTP